MKRIRNMLCLLLVLCLAAMMIPVAFAESEGEATAQDHGSPESATEPLQDENNSNNEIIVVYDDDATTLQLGDKTVRLFIDAEPGNLNFMDSAGTESNIPTKTHAEVTIPADINLAWLDADNVFDGSPQLTVTADGEIHASDSNNNLSQAYAVSSERAGDNSIDITVRKDVTCEATSYEPISIAVQATNDSDSAKSELNIVLEGKLTVKATSVADSTQAKAPVNPENGGQLSRKTIAHAVVAEGDVQVTVKGDVNVTATGGTVSNDATGIIATRGGNVTLEKNLATDGTGVSVDASSDQSTVIVQGDIMTAGAAVVINLDQNSTEKDLPVIVIGSIKDEQGKAVENPEKRIVVNGSSNPDLTRKAMASICYVVDKSGIGQDVSVTGTKKMNGFDGEVASAGDKIVISVGSSSVLEGVSAGKYATVTQMNEYTYVVTVKHGGNLVLTGRWTPAVSRDEHASSGAPANSPILRVKEGSAESGTAGESYVYEVNIKDFSQASFHVATLRSQITSRGLKYIVIRTPFGYFKVLAEDILSGLDDTDLLTFRLNGKTLEIRHGTELIATAELVNK